MDFCDRVLRGGGIIYKRNRSINGKLNSGKVHLTIFTVVLIGLVVIFSYGVGNVSAVNSTGLTVNKNMVNTVPGKDLVVTSVTAPLTGDKSLKFSFHNTIKNQGSAAASGFWVNYYLRANFTSPTKYIGHRYISNLGAGTSNSQNTVLTIPNTIASGRYYISVYADSSRMITESNEHNNFLYSSSTIKIHSIKGYWINNGPDELNYINVTELKKEGVSDLFVLTNKQNPTSTLKPFVDAFSGSGIKINAWITCFKNREGKWFDPRGNPVLVDELVKKIASIATNYNVDGIHLDYVRYPGTAYRYSNAVNTVTSFVQRINGKIQNINNHNILGKHRILLSAALMPECSINSYYYGQNYGQLAHYMDFLVPMIYKGNYNQNTNWIAAITHYIKIHANGKPVVAGLLSYSSDNNPVPLSASRLKSDINAALTNGSSGFVLFKYGLVDSNILRIPAYKTASITQITTTAAIVKAYIEKNKKLPSNVTLNGVKWGIPTFFHLLLNCLSKVSKGYTGSIEIKVFRLPLYSSETLISGNMIKNDYLSLATNIRNFMDVNGAAPKYMDIKLGKIRYESLIYMYSRIINYYGVNKVLPSNVMIKPWFNPKSTYYY